MWFKEMAHAIHLSTIKCRLVSVFMCNTISSTFSVNLILSLIYW